MIDKIHRLNPLIISQLSLIQCERTFVFSTDLCFDSSWQIWMRQRSLPDCHHIEALHDLYADSGSMNTNHDFWSDYLDTVTLEDMDGGLGASRLGFGAGVFEIWILDQFAAHLHENLMRRKIRPQGLYQLLNEWPQIVQADR